MRRIPLLALLGSLGLFLVACAGRPATTQGLVYYPASHVYVMHAYPGVYYHESYRSTYYRLQESGWEQARSPIGPWRPVKKHRLPPGLRKGRRSRVDSAGRVQETVRAVSRITITYSTASTNANPPSSTECR